MPDWKRGVTAEDVPMRSAMNEVTRAAYVRDCAVGVQRWNRLLAEAGCDFRFRLPSPRVHRAIGVWAGATTETWRERQRDWLPSAKDRAFVNSLMRRHRARQGRGLDRPARDRHQQHP